MRPISIPVAAMLTVLLVPSLHAQDEWSVEQRSILEAIDRLSATTAPGGGGPEAYGEVLTADFSRWTLGGATINDAESWVDGMRDWWDDGWRVIDREAEVLEISVRDDEASVRRIVGETYRGPGDETTSSKAALAEVWRRDGETWKLARVDIYPLPTE